MSNFKELKQLIDNNRNLPKGIEIIQLNDGQAIIALYFPSEDGEIFAYELTVTEANYCSPEDLVANLM